VEFAGFSASEWLLLVQYELLLFAGLFFCLGAVDELAVDGMWLWLRLSGRAATPQLADHEDPPESVEQSLNGRAAIVIPAWQEAAVLPTTVRHMLGVWPHANLTLYVGCYCNDGATIAAMLAEDIDDPRLRIVVHDIPGPTTKADCLNRLYRAIEEDEQRSGEPFRMVVLHDAEDMVDRYALDLLDQALDTADFAQLPVLPSAPLHSRWIASHYCEEFAEAHGKGMVVRGALGAGLPSAGVGCAVARGQLAHLAKVRRDGMPFEASSLTEDYQLGMAVARNGGQMRFVRVRRPDGALVATRACFPDSLVSAVKQKTRWLHGIAFQGWDSLGWSASPVESWMWMRDRRGPFAAFILALAYLLVVIAGLSAIASALGMIPGIILTPLLWWLLAFNLANVLWRALFRFAFTAREYGAGEGLRAVLRIPIANIIAIMAGRRAFTAYLRSFSDREVTWEKTDHVHHPVKLRTTETFA
jgi:bacteriophage N4 adsorption protein B